MPLQAFAGSFTPELSTGNKAYTGVGFQPQVILFQQARVNGANVKADEAALGIGVAVSSTERWLQSSADDHGPTTSFARRALFNDRCCGCLNVNATWLTAADLVSMDADGFTLNWLNVQASGSWGVTNYLALAGLSNVKAMTALQASGTGNESFTGVGFKPDAIIVLSGSSTLNTIATHMLFSLGMATGPSNQHAGSHGSEDNQPTSDTIRNGQNSGLICVGYNNLEWNTATLVSLDADGFTINKTVGASNNLAILALKGLNAKVSTFSQRTSAGSQSITGVGFQPKAVIFNSPLATSLLSSYSHSIGWCTSGGQGCVGVTGVDGFGFMETDSNHRNNRVIDQRWYESTLFGDASRTSLDADGFTLNWANTNAGYSQGYLALGDGTGPALVSLDADITAGATLTAALTVTAPVIPLDADITAGATLTAELHVGINVAANITAGATLTALLSSTPPAGQPLDADITAGATLTANLTVIGAGASLASDITAGATLIADLSGSAPLGAGVQIDLSITTALLAAAVPGLNTVLDVEDLVIQAILETSDRVIHGAEPL